MEVNVLNFFLHAHKQSRVDDSTLFVYRHLFNKTADDLQKSLDNDDECESMLTLITIAVEIDFSQT